MIYFLPFLTVCLSFKTAKLSSIVVSLSLEKSPSSKTSVINSPLLCKKLFFSFSSFIIDNSLIVLDNSRIFEKVSIIAIVVSVACLLFKIVASMYSPFSVKAVGNLTFPPPKGGEVANCDFTCSHSSCVSSIK